MFTLPKKIRDEYEEEQIEKTACLIPITDMDEWKKKQREIDAELEKKYKPYASINDINTPFEGELDLGEFSNLKAIKFMGFINPTKITSTNLSKNTKLTEISLQKTTLTSIDFLNQLPNPEKLEVLEIYDNNIQPTTLDFLRPFVNLKDCKLGLNKQFCIAGTDVDSGLEYIPENLAKLSSKAVKEGKNAMEINLIDCQPLRSDAKVAKIQDQLRPFNYDLEA
ncbi:hypothetical protein C1645_836714 [Glomus cerebriforme]|uniref:Uncharacterized protein n=1 Tax=Glomus cerebriforme TaxID=658196 RepID=A0A397S9W2_9GLOM|nr:hypothetical protein C1645_836714 [Glomus cerebriforme]